jgi:hypothetical protein
VHPERPQVSRPELRTALRTVSPKAVEFGASGCARIVDDSCESVYIRSVPSRKIQIGQVWKNNDTGESFLVTKTYAEALGTYAVLRKAGAEGEPPIRIKVTQSNGAAGLPGYTFTQESDEF